MHSSPTATNFILSGAATSASSPSVVLTNCILANATNLTDGAPQLKGSYNDFFNSSTFSSNAIFASAYSFQTVGGGPFYLAEGSPFRVVGSTLLDPAVTARGNERKHIFRDDADRCQLLGLLAEPVERFGARIHARSDRTE